MSYSNSMARERPIFVVANGLAREITESAGPIPDSINPDKRLAKALKNQDMPRSYGINLVPFMRDICYLHGFVERHEGDNDRERYVAFFTDTPTPEEEERAFAEAWQYLQEAGQCSVYYYSKYERTIWRKLREKYPGVCTEEELEQFFDPGNAVDLYFDVVLPKTEWPTKDYSIKTLAKYLGFSWRDTHPSGAASIEWFHRWVDSGDLEIKQRILDYNEDDCRATRVLLDGIRALPVRS